MYKFVYIPLYPYISWRLGRFDFTKDFKFSFQFFKKTHCLLIVYYLFYSIL